MFLSVLYVRLGTGPPDNKQRQQNYKKIILFVLALSGSSKHVSSNNI